jgi:hypothetical protein
MECLGANELRISHAKDQQGFALYGLDSPNRGMAEMVLTGVSNAIVPAHLANCHNGLAPGGIFPDKDAKP